MELHSPADKQKVLRQELRIFGIKMFGGMVCVEDADYKRTLLLKNITYGSDAMEVQRFLSALVEPRRLRLPKSA